MSTIKDTYRFYITLPMQPEIEVFPSNDSLKWKQSPYKDECFFRKELDSELIIDDRQLFKTLWTMQKDKCRCNVLPFRMSKNCCGVVDEDFYKGIFALVDGEWNIDRCRLTIKPRLTDQYSCLLRSWEDEKNFLEIEDSNACFITYIGQQLHSPL